MNKEQALHSFWSSFNLPTYDENSVPSEEERIKISGSAFPIITYEVVTGDFDTELPMAASLWYRSDSWAAITEKANEIERAITRGGRMVSYEGGAFWLRKRNSMRMSEPTDDMIRRILMNLTVEFID